MLFNVLRKNCSFTWRDVPGFVVESGIVVVGVVVVVGFVVVVVVVDIVVVVRATETKLLYIVCLCHSLSTDSEYEI